MGKFEKNEVRSGGDNCRSALVRGQSGWSLRCASALATLLSILHIGACGDSAGGTASGSASVKASAKPVATTTATPAPVFVAPKPSSSFPLRVPAIANAKFNDIAKRLGDVLTAAGYSDLEYFRPPAVPDGRIPRGFVVITKPEQCDDHGKPLKNGSRWDVHLVPIAELGWSAWWHNLLATAPDGHWRAFAFAVTDDMAGFSSLNRATAVEPGDQWHVTGAVTLPDPVATDPLIPSDGVQAFVYEFVKDGRGSTSAQMKYDGLPARDQLELAGLLGPRAGKQTLTSAGFL